jgi:CBS domain-containing protein
MNVETLMSHRVVTCRSNDSLHEAARLMYEHDLGSLVVLDATGQLVGMLTDRDICMAAYNQNQPLAAMPVSLAMCRHVVTCYADDSDVEVTNLMAFNRIHRVPVVDDAHRPIGIVSLNDLAIAMTHGSAVSPTEIATTLAAICEHRPIPLGPMQDDTAPTV